MNTAKLVGSLLIPLVASANVHADQRPNVLDLSVSSMGYGPSLHLSRANLYCEVRKPSGVKRFKLPPPSRTAWQDFRTELDRLKVWRWEGAYSPTSLVYDGTRWSLSIKYADAAVSSAGSNEYPDFDGRPSGSEATSDAFHSLLAAIRKLAPGCAF